MSHPSGEKFTGTEQYIVSDALARAVDVARTISRPLLVKGEPGTGKTLLAVNVAKFLGLELIRWQVKSTTKAIDGLYTYDTVKRLHDSRFGEGDVGDIRKYISMGPMGRAFASEQRSVVLIDEIDKADPEFEAFLLEVLSDYQVSVPELGTLAAVTRPMVLLTSNAARELSDALRRRCLHLHIDYPEPAVERRILRLRFPELPERLGDSLVAFVQGLRGLDLKKLPAVSETLDWARTLILLNAGELGEDMVRDTLAALLKHEEDVTTATAALPQVLQAARESARRAAHA